VSAYVTLLTRVVYATPDTVPENTPGYSLYVKEPIDISTIEARLKAGQYDGLAAFEAAFTLMYDNCNTYNDPRVSPTGVFGVLKEEQGEGAEAVQKDQKETVGRGQAQAATTSAPAAGSGAVGAVGRSFRTYHGCYGPDGSGLPERPVPG